MSTSVEGGTDLVAALGRRGLVKQTTGAAALGRLLGEREVTFYLGIDPTGPSLHAGHLVGLLAMAHLQRAGHRPVLLIGGGTARVGDPSDKDDMRPLLPVETVARNAALMQRQVGRFIDLERTVVVDNAAWLADLGYLDFLRDIGRHFSVNRMLSFEAYRRRLQTGLSFLEFNYLLLQAYDYLVLHRQHGCLLQIGGDDQWANILAGVDLIRRVERTEAHALTWPLVTTADGKKMGKTAAGALFLDPARVSPYEFYQYWINVPDADVGKLLALLTLLPDGEVAELSRLRDRAIMAAKERLALELTGMVHGAAEAERARATSRALFGARSTGHGVRDSMPTAELAAAELAGGIRLVDLLARSSLCASKSDARRLIQQGGARVADRPRTSVEEIIALGDVRDGELVLRAGKKRYFRFLVR
ncbi:MAG: tyrosine--tRNA ligase [Spirochaetaceae bacterium]|nr:tyrosine--tRNA ligase [Spirochaetaceae bacterium]